MKKNYLVSTKNFIFVVFGTMMLALGTGIFIVPYDIVCGGLSGLAIIINKSLEGSLSIDLIVTILTWFLFFIGLFILGKDFALKTLLSTILYPIFLSLSLRLISDNVLNGFFNLVGYIEYGNISLVLASIFGGVLIGVGCAITFLGGGSTGGVDILAFVICKFFKKLRSSAVIFMIDALVIIVGMFVIEDFVISLLGVMSAFVTAIVIDKVFMGEMQGFIAQIFTDKYLEINEMVVNVLGRTTTIFDVVGGYTLENKKMVMVSFSMREYAQIMAFINMVDKLAFVTIHRAYEINGEGWTRD